MTNRSAPLRSESETYEELRAEWLALEGADALDLHGWLIGVCIALERGNGASAAMVDRLIAELRASTGPIGARAEDE